MRHRLLLWLVRFASWQMILRGMKKLPLAGFKVVVTRPRDLISTMSEKLREKGAEVLEIPAIATVKITENNKMQECMQKLNEYDWITFTSPTGVKVFFQDMKECHMDIRKLGNCKIAKNWKWYEKVLEEKGLYVDLMPEISMAIHWERHLPWR